MNYQDFIREASASLDAMQRKHGATDAELIAVLAALSHQLLSGATTRKPAPPQDIVLPAPHGPGHLGPPGMR